MKYPYLMKNDPNKFMKKSKLGIKTKTRQEKIIAAATMLYTVIESRSYFCIISFL